MGSDRMHPQGPRKLINVIARPLSVIFERSQGSGELPQHWKKANVTACLQEEQEGESRQLWFVSLTSIPGKVMEHILLGTISKHMNDK